MRCLAETPALIYEPKPVSGSLPLQPEMHPNR